MYAHHRQTLEKLVEKQEKDPSCLAVITSGSVAQGTAKETSDVDVHLVFTDEAYEEYDRKNRLSYVDREVSTYEGGYADIKVINLRFLELAAGGATSLRGMLLPDRMYYSPESRSWVNWSPEFRSILKRTGNTICRTFAPRSSCMLSISPKKRPGRTTPTCSLTRPATWSSSAGE